MQLLFRFVAVFLLFSWCSYLEVTGQDTRVLNDSKARFPSLLSKRNKLQEELRDVKNQVYYEVETSYLQESTTFGNTFKGFEGFLSSFKNMNGQQKLEAHGDSLLMSWKLEECLVRVMEDFEHMLASHNEQVASVVQCWSDDLSSSLHALERMNEDGDVCSSVAE